MINVVALNGVLVFRYGHGADLITLSPHDAMLLMGEINMALVQIDLQREQEESHRKAARLKRAMEVRK